MRPKTHSEIVHRTPRQAATVQERLRVVPVLFLALISLLPGPHLLATESPSLDLPWADAGLTERQAAIHLLDRLTYGPRPGDLEAVLETGLETWVEEQLGNRLPDPEVKERLRDFRSLDLSARKASETYVNPPMALRMATREGAITREEAEAIQARQGDMDRDRPSRDGTRAKVFEFAREQGLRPMRELLGELMVQKLVRAVYSENQLHEVLTDFWFNHFNVSLTDNDSRVFIPAYERDAIRPFVLGEFRAMLEATAKHPAMLLYLDNARSVAADENSTTLARRQEAFRGRRGGRGDRGRGFGRGQNRGAGNEEFRQAIENRRPRGLNENYARELMELHTLGVDGGYTQEDVVEVARAFTGWTTYPPGPARKEIEQRIARARRYPEAGFLFEESFLFRADAHDAGTKTVLGRRLAPGRGMEDGLEVLDLLAAHPSTAQHLAHKLAVRFVADEPPQDLVDRLAQRFLKTGGDLEATFRALLESPEFWDPSHRGAKIKSPFELAASSLRALNVDVQEPRPLVEWVQRMGQPLYAYQAPTGYPDSADAWVNTGSLLHRMNFGLQLATGRLGGLEFDLKALNQDREPESMDDALATYAPLLLPERDVEATLKRLQPVVGDPELSRKIEEASPQDDNSSSFDAFDGSSAGLFPGGPGRDRFRDRRPSPPPKIDDSPVAQVVGVILGSPEFQRR